MCNTCYHKQPRLWCCFLGGLPAARAKIVKEVVESKTRAMVLRGLRKAESDTGATCLSQVCCMCMLWQHPRRTPARLEQLAGKVPVAVDLPEEVFHLKERHSSSQHGRRCSQHLFSSRVVSKHRKVQRQEGCIETEEPPRRRDRQGGRESHSDGGRGAATHRVAASSHTCQTVEMGSHCTLSVLCDEVFACKLGVGTRADAGQSQHVPARHSKQKDSA